jgi:hypothetical protein
MKRLLFSNRSLFVIGKITQDTASNQGYAIGINATAVQYWSAESL